MNIFLLITLACSLFLAIYIYYLIVFSKGLNNKNKITNQKKTVSVIIAARNEEENITHILTSLVNQSYSKRLFEVIIANDNSEDRTEEIIERFSEKWNFIKHINITNRNEVKSPKKNALQQAIAISNGEILLLTDADCIVPKYWIESMVRLFTDKTDMVVGFSRTLIRKWESAKFVEKFEFFDFAVLLSAGAGAIGSKKYFGCNGQNLGYTREAFEHVGGFDKINHLISGDDNNLMQLFRKKSKNLQFNLSPHSFVYTKPIKNWVNLINQRTRWASNIKHQIFLNFEFFIYLTSIFFFIIMTFSLFLYNWLIPLFLIAIKSISEFIFFRKAFTKFRLDKRRLRFYPKWVLIQPFFNILIFILGQLDYFKWNGRK